MTNSEYHKNFIRNRKANARLLLEAKKQVDKLVVNYTYRAAKVAEDYLEVYNIVEGLDTYILELEAEITAKLSEQIQKLQSDALTIEMTTDQRYMLESLNSRYLQYRTIEKERLDTLFKLLHDRILAEVNSRSLKGFTVSQRITASSELWGQDIMRLVQVGNWQGYNPKKTARFIREYVDRGRDVLIKSLDKNNINYKKSLELLTKTPKEVQWRARRLARSELYTAIQKCDAETGKFNPANTGLFNWVLNQYRKHWDCSCQQLHDDGPYRYEDIPAYPHPNCMCQIEPILMDHDTFINDLIKWDKGEPVSYLDDWYSNYYIQADFNAPNKQLT